MTYAAHQLYREVAYVAYHFHWSLGSILDMEHRSRRQFVDEIAHLNLRLAGEGME